MKENKQATPEKEVDELDSDYDVNLKDLVEEQRVISGIHDIYGNLFEELGFRKIINKSYRKKSSVEIFKNIVLGRIANPQSKRATVSMLEEHFGVTIDLERVYNMMDLLDDEAINKLNDLSFSSTRSLFQDKLDVIFFDCTTLYFESFTEDSFRQNGYSKDLKFNQPQVLLALMVTKEGLPIGYKAFSGSTYEGHALIPALEELRQRYKLDKVVFVADAGMFNKDNLSELNKHKKDISYIVGSRIKNMSATMKEQILDVSNYTITDKGARIGTFDYDGQKLIVSYSEKRARKDAADREKGILKLKEKLEKNKSTKEYLSNYGYKKYLKVNGNASFELNEEKIESDKKWDGLHGVITNSKELSEKEVLNQYNNLWQVEYAFRVTKHDLKVRPIFHWKPSRVRAHLAISFAAFTLIKHMEYRIKLQYKKMSPEKIREALVGVQTSILYDRKKKIRFGFPSKMSLEAKKIYRIFKQEQGRVPYIIKKM